MKNSYILLILLIAFFTGCSESGKTSSPKKRKKEFNLFETTGPIDVFGEKIKEHLPKIEKTFRIKFPPYTNFLVFRYDPGFVDSAAYLKIEIPKNKLDDFLKKTLFKKESLEEDDSFKFLEYDYYIYDIEDLKGFDKKDNQKQYLTESVKFNKINENLSIVIEKSNNANDMIAIYLKWCEY